MASLTPSMHVNLAKIQQRKEAYNHELISSEDFYVSEMEAIILHIVGPLSKNALRCGIKVTEVDFVFNLLEHMFQFHLQLLRIIRDEVSVVSTFNQYIGFTKMYNDYLDKYNAIISIMAQWSNSQAFREFVYLRLQNKNVKEYLDDTLCSLPWYLYRPFERMKQYNRFFRDLAEITNENDPEYGTLIRCKKKINSIYKKIIEKDKSLLMRKTRLLEIEFCIFGNPDSIVGCDNRQFVYNRMCQIIDSKFRMSAIKKYKHVHLYVFNDSIFWCSKRGHFKKCFYYQNNQFYYGIPKNNKKPKKQIKTAENSNSTDSIENSVSVNNNSNNESTQGQNQFLLEIGIKTAKNKKLTLFNFVNKQARDQCYAKIKKSHHKYLKKLVAFNRHKKSTSSNDKLNVSKPFDEISWTPTTTSEYDLDDSASYKLGSMKPLQSHKMRTLPFMNSNHSVTSSTSVNESISDESSTELEEYSKSLSNESKSKKFSSTKPATVYIPTIKEEDEETDFKTQY